MRGQRRWSSRPPANGLRMLRGTPLKYRTSNLIRWRFGTPSPQTQNRADSPMADEPDGPTEDARTKGPELPIPGILHGLTESSDGLPPLHEMSLELPDGSTFEAGQLPRAGALRRTTRGLGEIRACHFGVCPICGASSDLTKEHVPQGQVGGRIMTSTCRTCNNKLGSRVEADLTDWYDGALARVGFEVEGVKGRRHSGRALLRTATDGRFALIFDRLDPDIKAAFNAGAAPSMTWREELVSHRAAALKHAYLAACTCIRRIPVGGSAERIRRELLAARDTPGSQDLSASTEAQRVQLYRTYTARTGPPLGLHEEVTDNAGSRKFLISLGGTLLVSWPFDDLSPFVPGARLTS